MNSENDSSSRPTRRRLLGSIGGAGAVALAGCIGSGGSTTATTTERGSVTIALSTAESGHYSRIGASELNGFELAVKHLNEGGGLVDEAEYEALSGNGVLDNTIETEIYNTEGNASIVESALRPRLNTDEISMFTGGISGSVVRTHRDLADEYETPYFAGTSTLTEITGGNCSPYVYRHLFDSTTLARALVPEIASDLSGSQSFLHIFSETPEGTDLFESINDVVQNSDLPWRPTGGIPVRSGTTNFETAVNEDVLSDISLVFLDLFGLDAVNAIQWARNTLSEETTIVIPYLTQSVADALGEQVQGIYGTVGWHEALETPLSHEFAKGYQREYGSTGSATVVPPGPAHTIYGQVVLYAYAVERAGSFDPTAVRNELEGLEYALGAGAERMRACDHQSLRSVPVVRGQSQTTSANYYQLRGGRRGLEGGCEESPASDCEL